mgnify:CR=1 FL=1
MKKILLISISLFLILISCSQKTQKKQTENDIDKFLNLFKTLTTDKLTIISTEYLTDTTEYEFRGKVIDTSFYKFIKDRYLNLGLNKYGDDRYYACYKRKLNDSTYMLIMRTPYEYWESSVKLYLFDLNSTKTTDYIEAAQNWGDAGDYLEKHSILENLNIKTYKETCWVLNEETMESDCTDSIHDYRIKGDKFFLVKKTESKK